MSHQGFLSKARDRFDELNRTIHVKKTQKKGWIFILEFFFVEILSLSHIKMNSVASNFLNKCREIA